MAEEGQPTGEQPKGTAKDTTPPSADRAPDRAPGRADGPQNGGRPEAPTSRIMTSAVKDAHGGPLHRLQLAPRVLPRANAEASQPNVPVEPSLTALSETPPEDSQR